MKSSMYINGIAGISAQSENGIFEGEVATYGRNIFPAVSPDYKKFIPPMAIRRMTKAIKMGVTTAKMALQDAGVETPEAIITGTGEGCKQNTDKFLQAVLVQKEQLLSPTAFIQSTHNSVSGQIALGLKCTCYNMTYSHSSSSLEWAFMDAQLCLHENPAMKSILVGGVDEISDPTTSFLLLDGQLKQKAISNLDLFREHSPGTIISEGAHFFTLSREKTDRAYAEFVDITVFNEKKPALVSQRVEEFLKKNDYTIEDIDLVILGNNGDNRYDHFYQILQDGIFVKKPQVAYKHLTGDYNTASGYAVWLGCRILKGNAIPPIAKFNTVSVENPRVILIYNQYLGENHSIILITSL